MAAKAGDQHKTDKTEFFYAHSRYWGQFSPKNLVFNTNLQEFS